MLFIKSSRLLLMLANQIRAHGKNLFPAF